MIKSEAPGQAAQCRGQGKQNDATNEKTFSTEELA